ncbi:hypothetical protein Fcan01_28645 [Folsomia candida]|uniref:Uncharacterized protein n=1 Tax=Folsomia candida TaxID=158441 RepID=A0A226CSY3_FOLCA|nr:hypothetical protein Fcan01_28645 [Folsomia candida]
MEEIFRLENDTDWIENVTIRLKEDDEVVAYTYAPGDAAWTLVSTAMVWLMVPGWGSSTAEWPGVRVPFPYCRCVFGRRRLFRCRKVNGDKIANSLLQLEADALFHGKFYAS